MERRVLLCAVFLSRRSVSPPYPQRTDRPDAGGRDAVFGGEFSVLRPLGHGGDDVLVTGRWLLLLWASLLAELELLSHDLLPECVDPVRNGGLSHAVFGGEVFLLRPVSEFFDALTNLSIVPVSWWS